MKIISSLFSLRILTVVLLLISVKFITNSQPVAPEKIVLSHPLNSHPLLPNNPYQNQLFRSLLPETLKVYAIMVQFKPDNNPQTTGDGRFDVSSNYPDSVDAPPHDSLYFTYKLEFLKNYYYKASKGKLIINYIILPTIRNLALEMQDYSPRRTENLQRMGNFFFDVWRSADSVVDFSGIDPSKSAFFIFHAGAGRDVDLASSGLFVGELDLPSIYMSNGTLKSLYGDTTQGYYTNEGVIIPSSCMLPEQEYRVINTQFGDIFLELGLNGIVVATLGSHLGLPDLFDTETGRTAIGRFGLMDGQGIFSYLGVFPPEPSAWEKQYMGWVNPVIVGSNGSYTTKAATLDVNGNESVHKVLISGKEYFLVENRNRDAFGNGQTIYFVKNGVRDTMNFTQDVEGFNSSDIWKLKGSITDVDELDWSLPGIKNDTANFQGGILVWHIDENVIEAKFASNTINVDREHKGVDVEEAKGSQDIGVVVSTPIGDLISDGFFVDFWYDGNHYRPANIYRNEFTQTSFPNSKSYGNFNSRVCLNSFSQISPSMTFSFQQCGNVTNIANFPRFVGIDTSGNSQPMGFDFNDNGFDEIFINIADTLFGFRDNGQSIRVDRPNGFLKDSASQFAVGKLNYNISGQNRFVVGVSGNRLNLISFNIDSTTSAPVVLSFNSTGLFSSPHLLLKSISQPDTLSNRMFIGMQNGKIARFGLDNQSFSYDSVSNRKVVSLSYASVGTLPPVYSFITDGYKYMASGHIYFGQPIEEITTPVKVSNDNKIIRIGTSGDTVLSNNLGINTIYSSPTICDINRDGEEEIMFTADNKIFAINKFGVVLDNFPFSVPNVSKITSGIAAADINGDNVYEVIFGTGDGRIYAYSVSGRVLDGFPLATGSMVISTPAIVNSGGNFGLMVYSQDGYLYGYKTPWTYDSTRIYWKNFLRDANHWNVGSRRSDYISATGPCLPKEKVYNWPNPAYGKTTAIRYYLGGDASAVNIKIMDLSGELVTTLTGSNNKGFDNEVQWDISTVQSGIYVAIVELTGGSCGETASIKIAVVK
ncbi:MAG: hypothetical protein IT281_04110 [Ignavibacteria bacterium]|nr:hypothetical protein [Ignavibacteria bacterium]